MQYFMRYLHWEGRNICAHNSALFAFDIFLSELKMRKRWNKNGTNFRLTPQYPAVNYFQFNHIFCAVSERARANTTIGERRKNLSARYSGYLLRSTWKWYACVREIQFSEMMNTYAGNGWKWQFWHSIWKHSLETRQHVWDAHSYPNKFTDVRIRETATEFAENMGTSIRTCVIIMCHWNWIQLNCMKYGTF